MHEDFLHYVWKYQKLNEVNLKTTDGESITVVNVGQHNQNSGPDFFNSQLKIDGQLWAGNVEIHLKSSDWYVHNHETDPAYDNVILHVVWEHDADIFRKNNSPIPTLELNKLVETDVLRKYKELMSNKDQFINCEKDFGTVDDFVLKHWIDRLYVERLERKAEMIQQLLKQSNNDWEAVLFKMLAKYFGSKVNGDSFFSMAQSVDFSIIRKIRNDQNKLEALFYGQLQMMPLDQDGEYLSKLKREYNLLNNKFKLGGSRTIPVKYFRLRPPNFPTIRLSQLASIYHQNSNLFSQLQNLQTKTEFYKIFHVGVSNYWQTHYTFSKESPFSNKMLTKSFIDLLIINVIIPLKFCHERSLGIAQSQTLISLAEEMKAEKNSIVEGFKGLRKVPNSSMFSQGLIHLKTFYCDGNRCLHCEIGNNLLNG